MASWCWLHGLVCVSLSPSYSPTWWRISSQAGERGADHRGGACQRDAQHTNDHPGCGAYSWRYCGRSGEMTKEEIVQEVMRIASTSRHAFTYQIARQRRGQRHGRQQGWLWLGFFYVLFDYDDGDVQLWHVPYIFVFLWHTFQTYLLYYFLRFNFIMLNIYEFVYVSKDLVNGWKI